MKIKKKKTENAKMLSKLEGWEVCKRGIRIREYKEICKDER